MELAPGPSREERLGVVTAVGLTVEPFTSARCARDVAADLTLIFGHIDAHGSHAGWTGENAAIVPVVQSAPSTVSHRTLIGAVAVTAFVGMFAGMILNDGPPDSTGPASGPLTTKAATTPVRPGLQIALLPRLDEKELAPPAMRGAPTPPGSTTPLRAAAENMPPSAWAQRTTGKAPVARKTTASTLPECEQQSANARSWCNHHAVMAADRRLRRAYDQASASGVPAQVLVNYGDRWAALLDQAEERPARVVAGYEAMTQDLKNDAGRWADRDVRR